MGLIQTVENMFSTILKIQEPTYGKYRSENVSFDIKNIDNFSFHEHNTKVVFDQVNMKIIYVSDTFKEMSGYDAADLKDYDLKVLMSYIDLKHYMYPYHIAKWTHDVFEAHKCLKNLKIYTCGLKVKNFKTKKTQRLLIRYSPLEVFEDDHVKLAAMTVDDVTHLIKSDDYWLRMETGENEKHINHFSSKAKKDIHKDILSKREKEILKLIAEGKESKEIAEELFISLNTVENHRRNMIMQTGARDTTALVQLCLMMNII